MEFFDQFLKGLVSIIEANLILLDYKNVLLVYLVAFISMSRCELICYWSNLKQIEEIFINDMCLSHMLFMYSIHKHMLFITPSSPIYKKKAKII